MTTAPDSATKLQDQIDVLRLNLQIATQQVALYRTELVNTAALLRQERAANVPLMLALFSSGAHRFPPAAHLDTSITIV